MTLLLMLGERQVTFVPIRGWQRAEKEKKQRQGMEAKKLTLLLGFCILSFVFVVQSFAPDATPARTGFCSFFAAPKQIPILERLGV